MSLLALPIGFPIAAEPRAGQQPRFAGQVESDFTVKSFQLNLHYVTLGTPRRDSAGEIENAVLLLHSTGDDAMEFFDPAFAELLYRPGQPLAPS
jgi:homoserine O-acetyltransferase/O-succinyltransferase